MNPLAVILVSFLLSFSMASDPQVLVMIVLKTAVGTFPCANISPLFDRFSRKNEEGKPVVNRISCPHDAQYIDGDFRYVLLQLEFDANLFQAYTFHQKKTSEHVVQNILQPLLLADEEVQVYSVQAPATTSEYNFVLDGYALHRGERDTWHFLFVGNATLMLDEYKNIVEQVKSSVTRDPSLSNAYGFQLAYFYPDNEILKCVVRFKNPSFVRQSAIKSLLQPIRSNYKSFDTNDVTVNVYTDSWNRPVLEPQVVVIVVLKTLDLSLTCEDTATLYSRFSGTGGNSQGTPVVNQVSCPKDATETMDIHRYLLLQFNFDANTMVAYASSQNENIEGVVRNILTSSLLPGENIQVVSVYRPETKPKYFFELNAIVTPNGISDQWRSDFWPNVQSFMQRYNGLLQNVESNIKRGENSSGASQFQFAYFYQKWGKTVAVMWFKNPNFLTENEIRRLTLQNRLPANHLFTRDLFANIIEVNGNLPIIDTPEDFGHIIDFSVN